ncbi:Jouberin [Dinochytrium kinnereticum]|nr:Jouberin [Dinochytrium kinnereticum]
MTRTQSQEARPRKTQQKSKKSKKRPQTLERVNEGDQAKETVASGSQTKAEVNPFDCRGMSPDDFTNAIVAAHITKADPLLPETTVLNPAIKLHFIDTATGKHLLKKDPNCPATTYFETEACTFVLPVMTHPFSLQKHKTTTPLWNETLVFQVDYLHVIRPTVVALFELVNMDTSITETESGWHRVAWAFLKLIGANGQCNTEIPARLQLYTYMIKTPGKGSYDASEVYRNFCSPHRKKYPSTLYVHIKARPNMVPQQVFHRAVLPLQVEIGKLGFDEVRLILKTYLPKQVGLFLAVTIVESNIHVIKIFEIFHGNRLCYLRGHQGLIYDLDWAPDKDELLSASSDGSVRIWSQAAERTFTQKQAIIHSGHIYCAVFHSLYGLTQIIATGSDDGNIRIWRCKALPTGGSGFSTQQLLVTEQIGPVTGLKMHQSGRKVLLNFGGERMQTLDTRVYRIQTDFRFPSNARTILPNGEERLKRSYMNRGAFSCCGQLVFCGSSDGHIIVWKTEIGGDPLTLFNQQTAAPISSVAFHPKDNYIAVASLGSKCPITVYVWDSSIDEIPRSAPMKKLEPKEKLLQNHIFYREDCLDKEKYRDIIPKPPQLAAYRGMGRNRPLVARWLSDVRKFFSTTASAASDLNRYFNGGTTGQALLSSHELKAADLNHVDDLLEGMTVHYAVHLTSILGHYSEEIRVNAVFLLFELACIFDKRAVELKKKLGKITLGFQTDDKGFHTSVHELFHYIGPALSSMAIAFVAGLECFFTCVDWTVRGICISALTRLVYENEKVFLEEDHLSAIYNLFFSLGSIPLISKIFPDRLVIIKALGLLSGLYAIADLTLTSNIIHILMHLKDKTSLEVEALKSTLKKIFEKLSEAQNIAVPSGSAIDSNKAAGFNIFLNLLSPHDEDAYDLLPWSLETYTLSIAATQPDDRGKRLIMRDYPPLTEFIKSLSNHFRASSSLVRYGACICLHSALTVYPSLLQTSKSILIFIISGVLDTDYLSSFLYLTMLETFCASFSKSNIKEMVAKLRHEMNDRLDYDLLFGSLESMESPDVKLSDILDKAVDIAPPLAPKLLHKLINALEYLSKSQKLRQIELVRIWSRKIDKFDTYAMQTLVPMLNDDDEEIKLNTVKVLRALMPSFATASPTDISFIWSYFSTHMSLKTKSVMLTEMLDLVKIFPIDRLSDDLREELLNTFIRLSFHKDASVRSKVYELIGSSGDFWRASSLYNAAIGTKFECLIIPLGILKDTLTRSLPIIIKGYDDLANFIEKNKLDLQDLIDSITHDANIDEFWNFYLEDAPENQLVRPDDYGYVRNFIHMPFWISILLTKLNVPPPPAAQYSDFSASSSLDILSFIVRIKLPGISPAILLQYLDLALDVAFNSPSSIVKVGALQLIEVFLLIFPGGVGTKLQDVRDVVRALIVDAEPDVVSCACRIYPLVFRCVSNNNTKEFHDYLRNEISVIQKGGLEAASDPLISGLSREEIENPVESSTILWIILPLYADSSNSIRIAFSKFLRKVPTAMDSLAKGLPAHPDDSYILNATTWEELLLDGAIIQASNKNLNDIVYELCEFIPVSDYSNLPMEDTGLHLPTVSEKLLSKFKMLAKELTGIIPSMNTSEVLYHLQELQKNPALQANAVIVMSELGCIHEAIQSDILDLLISYVNHDLTADNTRLIEASILGLKNLSEYSPPTLKQIVTKVTTPLVVHEGDLITLFHRVDAIKEFCAARGPELIKKYIAVVLSQRQPVRKRLYAIYLIVELAIFSGEEEISRVLDAIQVFLDTADEEEMKEKVYGSLSKIVGIVGIKHVVFKNLLGNARKALKNKDPLIRLRALSIFKIFTRHLSVEESMQFCFLLLADSHREVRKKAKDAIVLEGVLDFAIPGLKAIRPNSGTRRALILESCKLPSIQRLGVTINTNTIEEAKVPIPLPDDDPYNVKYYSSDRRRKLTDRYGLPESKFTRAMMPLTQSVMDWIEEKSAVNRKYQPDHVAKYQWELISVVVKGIIDVALDDTFEDVGDIEAEIHLIDTSSNLLFAFDGLDEKVTSYIDRLQTIIRSCNAKAEVVRESLYDDLENSFYFFNEFIDVPIVSEEQYVALEKYKTSTQEATLEMVKSGKLDKLSSLDAQKTEVNDVIDLKSEQLRKLTIIALHCTSGYGLFHALTLASTDSRLVSALQTLADMLENEHRGIRMASVEAITAISRIQLEISPKPAVLGKIQELVQEFLNRLKDENSFVLFRRRADIINLMAQLLVFVSDRPCRIEVLEQLIRHWKDPDSEVRTIAIKMLQHLGQSGLAEVVEGFRLGMDDGERPRPPDIMREVAALLSNPDYCEKDHLNSLLTWRFAEGRI